MANTKKDVFDVKKESTKDPNKIESGIMEYISFTESITVNTFSIYFTHIKIPNSFMIMGIPSYYKKLNSLVQNTSPGNIKWLFFDFNCIIYQCIPSHPFEESELISSVIQETLRIIESIQPEGVFIGVDGVVPMAKMRQQRMRRFTAAMNAMNAMNATVAMEL